MFITKKIPHTPSLRFRKITNTYFLNKKLFNFTVTLKSTGGRNNTGQVVTRHRKQILFRKFIKVDQLRCTLLLPARVKFLSKQGLHKWVAYIQYSNGSLSYIFAESMLFFRSVTQTCFYENSIYMNSYFLKKILGSVYRLNNFKQNDACFNIIPLRSKIGKFAKAAGTYCKILYKSVDLNFYFLKLPSGLTRKFSKLCIATFGRNMNKLHRKCIRGAAGRSLQFGFRSAVRGVAMNPVDHPHGGRTKTSQPEISPWGWVAKLNK